MTLISGYDVEGPWKNVANGRYSFAVKSRKKYFVKEFGRPKYPNKDLCAPDTFSRLKALCAEWESNRKKIIKSLQEAALKCRYIVAPVDLFLDHNKYYVVSERIEEKPLELEEICKLDRKTKLLIMKKFMEALKEIESKGIVHGDLKPANVFIIKTPEGYEPRLMDFDDSYFSSKPPAPDETVGSMEYYSPELGRYVLSDGDASDITCKSDVFAAGVIFHEYITSKKVLCHSMKYPCQTTREVDILLDKFPPDQAYLQPLIKRMLKMDYKVRPGCGEILSELVSAIDGDSDEPIKGTTEPRKTEKRKTDGIVTSPDGYKFKKCDDSSYFVIYPDGHKCIMGMERVKAFALKHGVSFEGGSPVVIEKGDDFSDSTITGEGSASDKAVVLEILDGGKKYKIRHKDGVIAIIPSYVYNAMVKKGQI